MTIGPGTRFGSYEITATIGAGGMGEVYRARDTKLNREVAIKVLPELFAADRDRVMRFEREAQTLAALNHPNIAQVFGIVDDPPALVMELVEGDDLAQRVQRGALPLDEALPLARQIAEALEAAHERGIVHRDLKPANVKVRPDGTVKVLDFGLAKAVGNPALDGGGGSAGAAQGFSPAQSPTFTSPALTQMGIILGTAAYMAPEQARGKPVDTRADVWAFGCVLFEMLSGRRAFAGEDVTETLAEVIKSNPDWAGLPADTPAPIRRLLRRCLEKDPRRRLRDAGSAVLEIDEALAGEAASPETSRSGAPGSSRGSWMPAVAVAIVVTFAALAAPWRLWFRPAAPDVSRLTITLASRDELPRSAGTIVAVSPDGRTLAYTVLRDRKRLVLRRSLDSFDATPIPGSEEVRDPFFSPDGRWLGGTRDRQLLKLPIGGGVPVPIAQVPSNIRGADWLADGRILLGSNGGDGLLEVPETGGPITTLHNPDGARIWYPQQLSDGRTVLFTRIPRPTPADQNLRAPIRFNGELHLFDRSTGKTRLLLEQATAGRVLPSGHLVFERDSAIWSVAFDAERSELRGAPTPVVQGVRVEAGRSTQFAVAGTGTLLFVSGLPIGSAQKQLLWLNRSEQQELLHVPARDYIGARLSPDEKLAAVHVVDGNGADLWVTDLALGTLTRISNTGGVEHPLWSRDGRSLVFSSRQDGVWRLVRRAADGTGDVETLASFEGYSRVQATGWLANGDLLVEVATQDDEGDIGVLPMAGGKVWRPIVRTANFEGHSALSPDGRWLAYGSDESGQTQVYIQPLPGSGPRQQVPGPGWAPDWTRDGAELVYLNGGPPRFVMRVDVKAGTDGRLTIGAPQPLANYHFYDRRTAARFYDATASGDRLLFISRGPQQSDDEGQLRVVLNWTEELRRLVPVR